MSSYMSFYVKGNDAFYPIATYGRSHAVFQALKAIVPYGHVTPLTKELLKEVCCLVGDRLNEFKQTNVDQLAKRGLIATFNNTVEDKLSALYELDQEISDNNYLIQMNESAIQFYNFLIQMIEEAEDLQVVSNEGIPQLNPMECIYCGIECDYPTLENIKS